MRQLIAGLIDVFAEALTGQPLPWFKPLMG